MVLNPAKGDEGNVEPLHVTMNVCEHGIPSITSYWQPTEADIANILAGGVVCLTVLGRTHPPLFLHVIP